MNRHYYSFNQYLRNIFGERVHRISLNAGFSCPNLDGTLGKEGCIYCNNKGFSPYARASLSIEEQIKKAIDFYGKRFKVRKFIAYFQSFTSTYADIEQLRKAYDLVRKFPQIVGVFISTRPDCIDEEKIKMISRYMDNYLVWIEYGLQTTHNRILDIIKRRHRYEDFLSAVKLTRKYGINVGAHVILGLPTATKEDMMQDAQRIAQLDLQGIKFHVLHVLKDTQLEEMYAEGKINLFKKEEYVKVVCDFLERIPAAYVISRLVSTASPDYLIAPKWINKKIEIIKEIEQEFIKRDTYQGYLSDNCRDTAPME